jgi:hypothetical protein
VDRHDWKSLRVGREDVLRSLRDLCRAHLA